MLEIPASAIASITAVGNYRLPKVVDLVCPHCVRALSFTTGLGATHVNGPPCRSHCPRCKVEVLFFDVALTPEEQRAQTRSIWIHPDPPMRARELDLSETPHLDLAYRSAVACLESGQWTATGVLTGRTLEALLLDLLKAANQEPPKMPTLGNLVTAVEKNIDLGKPIAAIADALRKGRNLSAHFTVDHEIDRATAEELIELLEVMIEYLMLPPLRVEELVKLLNNEPAAEIDVTAPDDRNDDKSL